MFTKTKHFPLMLVVLSALVLSGPVSASEVAKDLETPSTAAESGVINDADVEMPAGGCSAAPEGTTTLDFGQPDPTKQWGKKNMASCTYTCPGGLVGLCPDKDGYVKACVDDCCVLIPDCHGPCSSGCGPGLVCHWGLGCCVTA